MRDHRKAKAPSRRDLLKSATALAGAGAATEAIRGLSPGSAHAQGADTELARVQGARRILLKGGIVMTLDRQVGDYPLADVLIEDGKIKEVRPGIAAGEAAAVVDATNRIVMPGFIDTHHHFYQGILRNILSNGLLAPDYYHDISDVLTAVYQPADVYAGTLITALGMIDMGTTTAVDTSQVCHSPEHSDAGIRALTELGLRVVYAYSRGAGPAARFPQDIVRLQKSYFNSQDQLLTLALGVGLDPKLFSYAREVGVHTVSHGVNNTTERALLELGRTGLLKPGDEYIHCTHLSDTAWRLIKDTGGVVSLAPPIEMAMGHGMPGIQGALDHGIRPSSQFRRRRDDGAGSIHHHAGSIHVAAFAGPAACAQQRAEPAAAADLPRGRRIRHRRGRPLYAARWQGRHAHPRQGGRHHPAHGRPAQRVAGQQRAWHGREPDEPG